MQSSSEVRGQEAERREGSRASSKASCGVQGERAYEEVELPCEDEARSELADGLSGAEEGSLAVASEGAESEEEFEPDIMQESGDEVDVVDAHDVGSSGGEKSGVSELEDFNA